MGCAAWIDGAEEAALVEWILAAVLLDAAGGYAAAFLAQGGVDRKGRKLFRRLVRRGGRARLARVAAVGIGAVTGAWGAWLYEGAAHELAGFLLLSVFLLSCAMSDLRRHELHMDTILMFAAIGVLYLLSWRDGTALVNGLLGALLGAALIGLPYLLRRDAVGMGDIPMVAVCGLFTGVPGIVFLLFRAFAVMALFSIVQLLRKKATGKTEVPFAPFLWIGALI